MEKQLKYYFTCNKKIFSCMLLTAIIVHLLFVQIFAVSDMGTVNISGVRQQRTNWCWAACSESILRFFGHSVSQSNVVAYVKGNHLPNEGATDDEVQDGLAHWSVSGTVKANSLSYNNIKSEINDNKPIYAGWSWNSGGGHGLVIDGYDGISSSSGYVEYMDPADGAFHSLSYTSFVSNSQHVWDGTVHNLSNN